LSQQAVIPVKCTNEVSSILRTASLVGPRDIPITKEMKVGIAPVVPLPASNTSSGSSILLIHGYCSDINPFAKYPADWTGPVFFLQAKKSLTHDKFAILVHNHAAELNLHAYAAVGHSQGGSVALHLLNHYDSGLDRLTKPGRVVQSIGSPYLGNTGAGSAANLVKIFGFGCGENFDLTTDGSKLWLAGVTKEHISMINYYTTTYERQGKFFGDYCNLAVNLLLQWPNDGTAELEYAQLKGAVYHGNKEKWCHTTDQKYEAQYYDHARNQEMNAKAARP